jgi:hypothetical protein
VLVEFSGSGRAGAVRPESVRVDCYCPSVRNGRWGMIVFIPVWSRTCWDTGPSGQPLTRIPNFHQQAADAMDPILAG